MKLSRLAPVVVASLALTACATGQLPTQAATTPAAPAATAPIEAPAMWVVRDADTTIWLFGTVHGLPADLVWHQDQVRAALASSSSLVKELATTPDPQEMAGLMFPAGLDMQGPTLTSRLSEAHQAKLSQALSGLGLPPPMVERMRPWLAGLMLGAAAMQKTGLAPESGVEAVLKGWADARGLQATGLETPAEQIGFFRDLPEDVALSFLTASLDEWDQVEADMATMVQAWKVGDTATLDRVMNEAMATSPAVRRALLGARNERWARWIDQRMEQPGTVLIAVGAGHLVGADSVQVFLARDGHEAQRVAATAPRP